ncbi:MAG TPA: hypothetical protein DHN33_03595 [Eubacteriaceae bacterium]|nr:hypothetical protein [Eubacteriaceae bacterium]
MKKKGFTFVEIIVSMTILSIVGMIFLSMMAFMARTVESASAQRTFDDRSEEIIYEIMDCIEKEYEYKISDEDLPVLEARFSSESYALSIRKERNQMLMITVSSRDMEQQSNHMLERKLYLRE